MTKTVDNEEVEKFDAIAGEWWDPNGKFGPLHRINPTRLSYIRGQIVNHVVADSRSMKPLSGVSALDVGCGGGLVTEPLTRLGAKVTGIDPSPETITAARDHAEKLGLDIDYIAATTEDLTSSGRMFDCILALEVIEHVPDVTGFLISCAGLLKPGGILILSTLNRTTKSYALGIVTAEYILGWLPRGTHRWSRFITPDELQNKLNEVGLDAKDVKGLALNPLSGEWTLSEDCSVNYFITATKPLASETI